MKWSLSEIKKHAKWVGKEQASTEKLYTTDIQMVPLKDVINLENQLREEAQKPRDFVYVEKAIQKFVKELLGDAP